MSKQEESKLDKLKHLLGIRGHRGAQGSTFSSSLRPTSREFIFTEELLKEIGPQSPTNVRIKAVHELQELVCIKRLEPNAVEAVWQEVKDMLKPQTSKEERHAVLRFMQCLIKGQHEELGAMREYFFKVLKAHTLFEDLSPRLDVLQALTSDGKDLEYIEDEIGLFLIESMKDIMSSERIPDFLRLIVNVIKFNAAYLDEEIVAGIVVNTCLIATKTAKHEEVELCLRLLDTVICYSYLPLSSLNHFIFCLCQVLHVERLASDTWQLMRKLLGTHVGHSAIHTMCCILQDSGSTGSSALLLRGAVFFISMALWGSKRVSSLKYPPSAVLPTLLQSLIQSGAPVLANEIVLSVQRLITKYGFDQPILTWDLILDIIQKLLELIESGHGSNPVLVKNVHELLTSIEKLHSQNEFHGSTERFFSIIEMCANDRPESSILMLITHKVQFIYPSGKDNWIFKLNYLMDKYFRQEMRTRIRLKVLEVVKQIIIKNKYLYEEDLIQLVVVPHLADIDQTSDVEVKTKVVDLILELAESSQSPCAKELIDILIKVIKRPCQMAQPQQSPGSHLASSHTMPDRPRSVIIEEEDIMPALNGLIKLFKIKLYETPSDIAVELFERLVEHLHSHYEHLNWLLPPAAGSIRYKLLDLLMSLRADANQRLGLYEKSKSGSVIYSSFVVCCQRNKAAEDQSPVLPAEDNLAVMSYADVFKCIALCLEKEMDWNVLKLVLDNLPLVLQNKTLLLVADLADVDTFCASLQAMVSGQCQGYHERLLNVPQKMSKSDFYNYIFPVLTCLVSYRDMLDKQKQRDLVKCLEVGLVSKCAKICVQALTVCALEMDDVMMRQLPSVLLNLSKISATVSMAIPLMEFLSSLIHCPQLYSNFVEDQYLSVFAIALPYTNPFKYNHYTVSLAYNVIGLWFVKCRVSFRKGFVGFILQGLRSNVLRQIEEMNTQKPLPNQDSADRNRTQSLNDEMLRSDEASKDSRSRTAAASARVRKTTLGTPLDEDLSIFHRELMETCVDMLARYTFSTRSNIPVRSPVAEFLLRGGQSESWLLGNRIITITTSGGSKVGRAGLCEKCLLAARIASSKLKSPKSHVSPSGEGPGRRRHKSAAVRTVQETVPLRPLSQDDIFLHNCNTVMPDVMEVGEQRSISFELPEVDGSDVSVNIARVPAPLETRTDKIQAVDNVLMSLRAKPSDKSIFSPHLCNCWCTQWAEIHIRRPTGTFSWIMRIQNEEDVIESFPDFPLADISSLFMADKTDEDEVDNSAKNIDANILQEVESDKSWIEPLLDSLQQNIGCSEHTVHVSSQSNLVISTKCNLATLSQSNAVTSSQSNITGSSKDNITEHRHDDDVFTHEGESVTGKARLSSVENPNMDYKVTSQHENKHLLEERLAKQDCTSTKDRPSSVTYDAKILNSAEKSSRIGHVSPQLTSRSPKHEAAMRSSSVSSMTGIGHIPHDDITKNATTQKKTSVNTTSSSKSAIYGSIFGKEGPVQGGMNPSFLFLQLYHANFFGSSDDRPLHLPATESIKRSLKMLDMIYPFQTHKIGVIYVAPGQVDNEAAILSNQYGSSRYIQFIQGLGQIVCLQDCNKDMTYLGGLDAKGSDGQFTYIWQDEVLQLVYHIATMMPNKESDPNCTKKKSHIGNNHVTIVYNDSKMDYKIGTIKGQYNYVNIIIQPLDLNSNAVTVQTRDDIVDIIGHTGTKIISDLHLSALVRQMALHADVASIILQRQKSNPKDLFASNWLERLRQIKRIRVKVKQEATQPATTGVTSAVNRDPQGIMGGLNVIDDFTEFIS